MKRNSSTDPLNTWFASSFAGLQVLYVEDTPADQLLVQEILADENISPIELMTAESFQEAKEQLIRVDGRRIDVILLDLGLPDTQGLQTLRSVQSLDTGLPVVAITGTPNDEEGLAAIAEGAEDYLAKDQITIPGILIRTLHYAYEHARRLNIELADDHHAQPEPEPIPTLLPQSQQERPLRIRNAEEFNQLKVKLADSIRQQFASNSRVSGAQLLNQVISGSSPLVTKLQRLDADLSDILDLSRSSTDLALQEIPLQHAARARNLGHELALMLIACLSNPVS